MREILNYQEMKTLMEELYPILPEKVLIERMQRMGFSKINGGLVNLSVDGIAGPKTKAGVFLSPKVIDTPIALVALEELMLGSQEIGGPNDGIFVKKYFRLRTLESRNFGPYCAGFASYCLQKAYPKEITPYILGAIRLGNAVAKYNGRHSIQDAKKDDLPIWRRESNTPGTGHVGVFVSNAIEIDGKEYKFTIEGNNGNFPAPTRVFAVDVANPSRGVKNEWLFAARYKA